MDDIFHPDFTLNAEHQANLINFERKELKNFNSPRDTVDK